MNLKDKVVLVTGSSSGIGKQTAIKFVQKGAKVAKVIVATAEEKLGKSTGEDIDVWDYI